MRNHIPTTLLAALLLLPLAAQATTQSSPNYTNNAGRIVSGGTAATDPSDLNKSGISVGQGIFIPPGVTGSPGYSTKATTLPIVASGGNGTVHTGDINGDVRVDIVDALLALKSGVGLVALNAQETFRGDVGPLVNNVAVGNGKIDIEDTILILRKAIGLGW
jgi:hypothetical protein